MDWTLDRMRETRVHPRLSVAEAKQAAFDAAVVGLRNLGGDVSWRKVEPGAGQSAYCSVYITGTVAEIRWFYAELA